MAAYGEISMAAVTHRQSGERGVVVRAIGMDVHRDFCEVAIA
jgi:hypothetical protein